MRKVLWSALVVALLLTLLISGSSCSKTVSVTATPTPTLTLTPTPAPTITPTLTPTPTPTPSIVEGIDPETGAYGNYYLGLVREPTGVQVDSYGNLIVIMNNRNAQNPTYSQLLDFLSSDKTDLYPFQGTLAPIPSRYGSLESYVDLQYWKEIIDGTRRPNPPRTCADYA